MRGRPVITGLQSLWLVRHAESVGNVADADANARGAAELDLDVRDPDVELSDVGHDQAAALGRWMRTLPDAERPTGVLSSPYRRAADTARAAVSEAGPGLEVRSDERLRERDLGVFDGLTGHGIRESFPDEARRRGRLGKFYYRPPGGESWADVALRVRSLLVTLRLDHEGERLVLFSHQAVLLVVRYVVEGMSEEQLMDVDGRERLANCALTTYVATADGRMRLERYNDVSHLEASDEEVTREREAVPGDPEADRDAS